MIGVSTRLVALLGDPVEHSLSPRIQNEAFRAAGVDGVYLALRSAPPDLPGLIRGIARAGGAGNVTLPHKKAAARTVEERTEAVRLTGACNTFWSERGRIRGDNTDVAGFRAAVRELLGGSPAGRTVLLLGAGGAARAALVGLLRDGVEAVHLWNRTSERARILAGELGRGRTRVAESRAVLEDVPFDLIVNATSLGLDPDDSLPLDPNGLRTPGAVLDLVYRPDETRWVREARARGIPAADGGEMLVRQGGEAFRRWWGLEPPLEEMREALARSRTRAPGSDG